MWNTLKYVRCKKNFIFGGESHFEIGKTYLIEVSSTNKDVYIVDDEAAFTDNDIGEYFEHVNEIRKRKISKLLNSK